MSAISDAGEQYERFREAKRSGMSDHEAYMKTAGTVAFGAGSLDSVATVDGFREDTMSVATLPVRPDIDAMKRVEGKVIASRPLYARAVAAIANFFRHDS